MISHKKKHVIVNSQKSDILRKKVETNRVGLALGDKYLILLSRCSDMIDQELLTLPDSHNSRAEYDSYHDNEEMKKKHLDEKKDQNHYDEKQKLGKEDHSSAEIHKEYHKGEKSHKSSKFHDEEKYQKGHSTKGEHNILKKDAYEKKKDFYDEFHDDDNHENHGEVQNHYNEQKGVHHTGDNNTNAKLTVFHCTLLKKSNARYQDNEQKQNSYLKSEINLLVNSHGNLEEMYGSFQDERDLSLAVSILSYESQKLSSSDENLRRSSNKLDENNAYSAPGVRHQPLVFELAKGSQPKGFNDFSTRRLTRKTMHPNDNLIKPRLTTVIAPNPEPDLLKPVRLDTHESMQVYNDRDYDSYTASPSSRSTDSSIDAKPLLNLYLTDPKLDTVSHEPDDKVEVPQTQKKRQISQKVHADLLLHQRKRSRPITETRTGKEQQLFPSTTQPNPVHTLTTGPTTPGSRARKTEILPTSKKPNLRKAYLTSHVMAPLFLPSEAQRHHNIVRFGERRIVVVTELPQKPHTNLTAKLDSKNANPPISKNIGRSNSRAVSLSHFITSNGTLQDGLMTRGSDHTVKPDLQIVFTQNSTRGSKKIDKNRGRKFETTTRRPSDYINSTVMARFSIPPRNDSNSTSKAQIRDIHSNLNRVTRIRSRISMSPGDTLRTSSYKNEESKQSESRKNSRGISEPGLVPLFDSNFRRITAPSKILDSKKTVPRVMVPNQATVQSIVKAIGEPRHPRFPIIHYKSNQQSNEDSLRNNKNQRWRNCDAKITKTTHKIGCNHEFGNNEKIQTQSTNSSGNTTDKLDDIQQKITPLTIDLQKYTILNSTQPIQKEEKFIGNTTDSLKEMDSVENQPSKILKHHDLVENQNSPQILLPVTHRPDTMVEDLLEGAGHQHISHRDNENLEDENDRSGEHHSSKHHQQGEKDNESYNEFHEHNRAEKGYHDKENHDNNYDEKEGNDKRHSEEAKYYKEFEQYKEGEKDSAYKEEGKYNKGHNTKGVHVVHKKDEIDKRTEFFDDFDDDGESERKGGYHREHEHKKVGRFHKDHKRTDHNQVGNDEKGHYLRGHRHHDDKENNKHEGSRHYQNQENKDGKKGASESVKHWSHKNDIKS
ncbi:hypothetical protein QAD02_011755 [Eretmocerus hayati]|uniref:Uncharacterized protein n=1 Tax=Eretmocerus hayati TaxID=131215 RepID=A0ACC2NXF0_9HYME|nr:hypothetical protein QAD02_011755 [Eretmocerus hayati]